MPHEIKPSSERDANDRRSQSGNPEKRPQNDSTAKGFGSGPAGRHHLRFTDRVPSSSQAREQFKEKDIMTVETQKEYNRTKREKWIENNTKAIQETLAERDGKTSHHREIPLGYTEKGLRGGMGELQNLDYQDVVCFLNKAEEHINTTYGLGLRD